MSKEELDRILDAASKEVKSWPEWMQRPENRQRQPYNNKVVKDQPEKERLGLI